MEYEGVVCYNTWRIQLVELKKGIHGKTFHGNSDRALRDLRHFISGKVLIGWKIIHHRQGRCDAFGLSSELNL